MEIYGEVVVNATTHSLGSPKIFIPGILLRDSAPFWVASIMSFAFYLKPFIVIWVREYHAAALAKPDLEPGKVAVQYNPPFQVVQT